MNSEFTIRRPVADDVEYIIKTWMRTIHDTHPTRIGDMGRRIPLWPNVLFFRDYQARVILPLFRKRECRVVCPVADANIIEAFMVGRYITGTTPEAQGSLVCDFAYTRPPVRNFGLARACARDLGWREGVDEIVATHWDPAMSRWRRDDVIFNPLALYEVSDV